LDAKLVPRPVYRFCELPNGIQIQRQGCPEVRIYLQPASLMVTSDGREATVGFFEYWKLIDVIASFLIRDWKPRSQRKPWLGLQRWLRRQVARGLSHTVRTHWRRLLESAPPQVVAVQRAIHATTLATAPLTLNEEFYRHKYLVRDILQYRAARIAVAHAGLLFRLVLLRQLEQLVELHRLLQACGGLEPPPVIAEQPSVEITPDVALELLHDWRGLFAPDGLSYRSLDRTLMQLPGGLPSELVCNLCRVRLPRPILSRAELALVLTCADYPNSANGRVLLYATAGEIVRSLSLLAEYLCVPLSVRSTQSIDRLVETVAAFPEHHRGRLPRLTEKAIRWQRLHVPELVGFQRTSLGPDAPTALPPVALPAQPEIRFLRTAREVFDVGIQMQHCIAGYALRAIQGRCFLFQIDYEGGSASVEVDPSGRVIQAKGPRNRANRASLWGAAQLGRWGVTFPRESEAPMPLEENQGIPVDDVPF
jgi:hypothetical protein